MVIRAWSLCFVASAALFAIGCGGGRPLEVPDGDVIAGHGTGHDGLGGSGVSAGTAGATGSAGGGQGGGGSRGEDAAVGAADRTTSTDGGAGTDGAAGRGDAAVEMTMPDGSQGLMDTFDTSTEGWAFSPYGSTPYTMPPTDPDNLALTSTLGWDSVDDADGKTTSGSLEGTVSFRSAGDQVDFQAFTSASATYDWTGCIVTAKVKLVSGGNLTPGCPLIARFYVSQAPNYTTTNGTPVDLQEGNWVTLSYDMATAGINVAAISQMGIQITTGAACTSSTDGGPNGGASDAGVTSDGGVDAVSSTDGGASDAPAPTATTAVILIDDVFVTVK